jgi:hypothetical protein
MDPDAEFNRLRESVTDKKETKSKNKKVSWCICFAVKLTCLQCCIDVTAAVSLCGMLEAVCACVCMHTRAPTVNTLFGAVLP